jgi:hypothetical protein
MLPRSSTRHPAGQPALRASSASVQDGCALVRAFGGPWPGGPTKQIPSDTAGRGRALTPAKIERPDEALRAAVAVRLPASLSLHPSGGRASCPRRDGVACWSPPGEESSAGPGSPAVYRSASVAGQARLTAGSRDPRVRSSHQARRDTSALGTDLRRTRERS